jgi:hypothetical protein
MIRRILCILAIPAWLASLVVSFYLGDYYGFSDTIGRDTSYGRFLSQPKTEWLDDRKMRLLEDFVYVDPNENPWLAPKNSEIDGASIPQPLWSWIGSPFTGKYRNASIVHDVACDKKDKPPNAVHRMFFDACLAGGVPEKDAMPLYYAVARYGPKWKVEMRTMMMAGAGPDDGDEPQTADVPVTVSIPSEVPTDEDLIRVKEFFATNNPSAEEIEELAASGEIND